MQVVLGWVGAAMSSASTATAATPEILTYTQRDAICCDIGLHPRLEVVRQFIVPREVPNKVPAAFDLIVIHLHHARKELYHHLRKDFWTFMARLIKRLCQPDVTLEMCDVYDKAAYTAYTEPSASSACLPPRVARRGVHVRASGWRL